VLDDLAAEDDVEFLSCEDVAIAFPSSSLSSSSFVAIAHPDFLPGSIWAATE
jgi:hypothetical protein